MQPRLLLLLALVPSLGHAATTCWLSAGDSIQDVIDTDTCGIVYLAPGTYYGPIVTNRALLISGDGTSPDREDYVIRPRTLSGDRVITAIQPIVLHRLRVTGGRLTVDDSGLTPVDPTGDDIDFSEPTPPASGGCLLISARHRGILLDTVFDHCEAATAGGAVYATGPLAVLGSEFEANMSGVGGAIRGEDDTAIRWSWFHRNDGEEGGAVETYFGDLEISDSRFEDNVGDEGGAIDSTGATVEISDSEFSGNIATTFGGAIEVDDGTLTIRGSRLQGNGYDATSVVTTDGGAVAARNSDVDIRDTLFYSNHATNNGGSLYLSGSPARIERTAFGGSTANWGGNLYSHNGALDAVDTLAYLGSAGSSGGGFYLNTPGTGPTWFLDHTWFLGNKTTSSLSYGGGVYAGGNGAGLEIDHSVLAFNDALRGGSVSLNASDGSFRQGSIFASRAFEGGAVSLRSGASVEVSDSTFGENFGWTWGGAIAARDSSIRLSNATLYENVSSNVGGTSVYAHMTTLEASNSVLYHTPDGFEDCLSIGYAATLLGENLDGDDTCGGVTVPATDPLLYPLYGASPAYRPRPGSPTLDGGDDAVCTDFDQWDEARPQDDDGDGLATCDLGALEGFKMITPPMPPRGQERWTDAVGCEPVPSPLPPLPATASACGTPGSTCLPHEVSAASGRLKIRGAECTRTRRPVGSADVRIPLAAGSVITVNGAKAVLLELASPAPRGVVIEATDSLGRKLTAAAWATSTPSAVAGFASPSGIREIRVLEVLGTEVGPAVELSAIRVADAAQVSVPETMLGDRSLARFVAVATSPIRATLDELPPAASSCGNGCLSTSIASAGATFADSCLTSAADVDGVVGLRVHAGSVITPPSGTTGALFEVASSPGAVIIARYGAKSIQRVVLGEGDEYAAFATSAPITSIHVNSAPAAGVLVRQVSWHHAEPDGDGDGVCNRSDECLDSAPGEDSGGPLRGCTLSRSHLGLVADLLDQAEDGQPGITSADYLWAAAGRVDVADSKLGGSPRPQQARTALHQAGIELADGVAHGAHTQRVADGYGMSLALLARTLVGGSTVAGDAALEEGDWLGALAAFAQST